MDGVVNYINAYSFAPYGFLWACRDVMQISHITKLWAYREQNRSIINLRAICIAHYTHNENQPRA